MKVQKIFRKSLLLLWMTVMLWIMVIPVQADETKNTVLNQTVETQLQEEDTIQIEDVIGLDGEFEALEEESVLIIEEVERYRKETKRKEIQKAAVIILVIVILGAGIMAELQKKKKNIPDLTGKERDRTE